jgi:hypothetical protein
LDGLAVEEVEGRDAADFVGGTEGREVLGERENPLEEGANAVFSKEGIEVEIDELLGIRENPLEEGVIAVFSKVGIEVEIDELLGIVDRDDGKIAG